MFLVVVNDQPKARIEVSKRSGKWEPSAFAEVGLPLAVRDISRNWPKRQGYRIRYVNVMHIVSFVEVTRNDQAVAVFVSPSFASYFKLKASSFVEVDQSRVLPALRDILIRRKKMGDAED